MDVLVAQRRGIRLIDAEGHPPERDEQDPDRHGRGTPPQGLGPGQDLRDDVVGGMGMPRISRPDPWRQHLHADEEERTDDGKEGGDDVRQDASRQRDGAPPPVPSGAQSSGHEPEEQECEGDAQRIGVFAGQGGEEVPPVDRVRVVEEEAQRERGQRSRKGTAQAEEPPHGPRRDREQERSEHGDPLERQGVGNDVAEQSPDEIRQDEVVGVEREPVVPTRVPPGELTVVQQVRLQERRHGVVTPVVASCRNRGREQQAGVETPEHDGDHRDDAEDRGPARHPLGRSRRTNSSCGSCGSRSACPAAVIPVRPPCSRRWPSMDHPPG